MMSGSVTVSSGVTSVGLTISSGGSATSALYVLHGGIADATGVYSGGAVYVSRGGLAEGTRVFNGGVVSVYRGGHVSGTVLSAGFNRAPAKLSIFGTASGTVVDTLGACYVAGGGVAHNTRVNNGGEEYVVPGGTSHDSLINSGGTEYAAGRSLDARVKGLLEVEQNGVASHTVVDAGGTLFVDTGEADATIINGGQLIIGSGANADDGITFEGTGGLFEVDPGGVLPTAVISGFSAGDEMRLGAIPYSDKDKLVTGEGTVTIVDGKHRYTLYIAGATKADPGAFSFGSGSILTTTQMAPAMAFLRPSGHAAAAALALAPALEMAMVKGAPQVVAFGAAASSHLAGFTELDARPAAHRQTVMLLHSGII